MKYYTDDELLELVRDISGDSEVSYSVADKIAERFNQKNSTIQRCQERLNAAAEHMGHQLITDLVEEGY
jgi:hypothetical protein